VFYIHILNALVTDSSECPIYTDYIMDYFFVFHRIGPLASSDLE